MVLSSSIKRGLMRKGMRIGTGVGKAILKKGVKSGKRIGMEMAKSAGRKALKHGDAMLNTSIRGVGTAASSTAGNPAPSIAAEGIIAGKNYLAKVGAEKLMGRGGGKKKTRGLPIPTTAKSHLHYPPARTKRPTPRHRGRVGIASQSHAHDALSRLNAYKVNIASAVGRNLDHFSSATRPTGAKM
jgi:hypothetical protein